MTASQFYFPYFFDLNVFNKTISSFGLSSRTIIDEKIKIPGTLVISQKKAFDFFRSKTELLTIPFSTTLMVQDEMLTHWTTKKGTLAIMQTTLPDLYKTKASVSANIELRDLSFGHNKIGTGLELHDFVTYVRKEDLTHDKADYEKFVIVLINKSDINVIPFDLLDKTGTDFGYVWPATARFDRDECKLYGQGMRMADFTVEIDEALI